MNISFGWFSFVSLEDHAKLICHEGTDIGAQPQDRVGDHPEVEIDGVECGDQLFSEPCQKTQRVQDSISAAGA
jgi:hypothetical protein